MRPSLVVGHLRTILSHTPRGDQKSGRFRTRTDTQRRVFRREIGKTSFCPTGAARGGPPSLWCRRSREAAKASSLPSVLIGINQLGSKMCFWKGAMRRGTSNADATVRSEASPSWPHTTFEVDTHRRCCNLWVCCGVSVRQGANLLLRSWSGVGARMRDLSCNPSPTAQKFRLALGSPALTMKRKRKFGRVWGGGAHALERRRDSVQVRTAKPVLLASLFAAFLVFGLAYTFSGGSYPYYSLAAALVAGLGAYEITRLLSQGKIP